MREKIEDGSSGLPEPESLGEGEPDLHYFFLGEDAMDGETLQPKATDKGTMEQRPSVIRDMFMCVVLHNMLRPYQEGAPTPEMIQQPNRMNR